MPGCIYGPLAGSFDVRGMVMRFQALCLSSGMFGCIVISLCRSFSKPVFDVYSQPDMAGFDGNEGEGHEYENGGLAGGFGWRDACLDTGIRGTSRRGWAKRQNRNGRRAPRRPGALSLAAASSPPSSLRPPDTPAIVLSVVLQSLLQTVLVLHALLVILRTFLLFELLRISWLRLWIWVWPPAPRRLLGRHRVLIKDF